MFALSANFTELALILLRKAFFIVAYVASTLIVATALSARWGQCARKIIAKIGGALAVFKTDLANLAFGKTASLKSLSLLSAES
jgi:hypothetical protein